MAIKAIEAVQSYSMVSDGKNSTLRRVFNVTGTQSPGIAKATAAAQVAPIVIVDGVPLEKLTTNTDETGYGHYKVTFNWKHKDKDDEEKEPPDEGTFELSFDFSGETVKRTEAIAQVKYPLLLAPSAGPDGKTIGITDSGVEGADIIVPHGTLDLRTTVSGGIVSHSWISERAKKVGKVNDAAWNGYAEQELLFSRFAGTRKASGDYDVSWSFQISENETSLSVAGQTIAKKGWDYVWVWYKEKDDTDGAGGKVIRPDARGVYVARVYDTTDFSTLFF